MRDLSSILIDPMYQSSAAGKFLFPSFSFDRREHPAKDYIENMEISLENDHSSNSEASLYGSNYTIIGAEQGISLAKSSHTILQNILSSQVTSPKDYEHAWYVNINETDNLQGISESPLSAYGESNSTGYLDNVLIAVPMGLCLYCLSILTLIGNGMVLHAIRTERRLQTVSNMFIMSLAIADLTVGLFVMPISSTYVLMGDWPFGLVVCQIWLSADYTASTSSILNLLILSLDRYWSVRSPLKYMRKRTKKRALLMIAVVWIVSSLWILPIIGWHLWANEGGERKQPENVCETEFADNVLFKVTTSTANFYVPLLLMIGVYMKIYLEIKKRSQFEIGQCNVGGSTVPKSASSTPVHSVSGKTVGRKTDVGDSSLRPCRYTAPSRFSEYHASTPSSSSGPSSESSQRCDHSQAINGAHHHESRNRSRFKIRKHGSRSPHPTSQFDGMKSKRRSMLPLSKAFSNRGLSPKSTSLKTNFLCALCSQSSVAHGVHSPAVCQGNVTSLKNCYSHNNESRDSNLKADSIWRCDTCGKTIKSFDSGDPSSHEQDFKDSTSRAYILKDLRPFCTDCENACKLKNRTVLGRQFQPTATNLEIEDVAVLADNRSECSASNKEQDKETKRKLLPSCSCFAYRKKKRKRPVNFETHIEECDSLTMDSTPPMERKNLCPGDSPTRQRTLNSSCNANDKPSEKNALSPHLQVPLQVFRSDSFNSGGSFRRSSGFLSNLSTLRKSIKRSTGSHSLRQEKKAARQLGVIMGAFVLCWLPYIIIFIVTACCEDCLSPKIHTATIWLGYLNSTINPLIYALCNANFKRAFWKMAGRGPNRATTAHNAANTSAKARKAKAENMFA